MWSPGSTRAAGVARGLLAALTIAEKIALLHQHQPAVDRLGLAAFHTGCEALHGVAWIGRATVFPQAVGLGATWDRDLLRRVGEAVVHRGARVPPGPGDAPRPAGSREATMVSLNVWAPVVNLLRDPRWGRNEEGYSEDPYATARAGHRLLPPACAARTRAVWRTAPVLKHFLAYNAETDRDIDQRRGAGAGAARVRAAGLPRADRRPGVVAGRDARLQPGQRRPEPRASAARARRCGPGSPTSSICSDAQAPSNLVEPEQYFADARRVARGRAAGRAGQLHRQRRRPAPTIERFTEALAAGADHRGRHRRGRRPGAAAAGADRRVRPGPDPVRAASGPT